MSSKAQLCRVDDFLDHGEPIAARIFIDHKLSVVQFDHLRLIADTIHDYTDQHETRMRDVQAGELLPIIRNTPTPQGKDTDRK